MIYAYDCVCGCPEVVHRWPMPQRCAWCPCNQYQKAEDDDHAG